MITTVNLINIGTDFFPRTKSFEDLLSATFNSPIIVFNINKN